MDPSIVGGNLALPLILSMVTTQVKPLIARFFPGEQAFDAATRVFVFALGIALSLIQYFGSAARINFPGFEQASGNGFLAAAGAVLTYHLVADGIPTATSKLLAAGAAPLKFATTGLYAPSTLNPLPEKVTVSTSEGTPALPVGQTIMHPAGTGGDAS